MNGIQLAGCQVNIAPFIIQLGIIYKSILCFNRINIIIIMFVFKIPRRNQIIIVYELYDEVFTIFLY